MAWPVELGSVEMSPFITGHIGHHRWGGVLKRYFINSRGVAISVDPQSPLYVSINAKNETKLCLKVGYTSTFSQIFEFPTWILRRFEIYRWYLHLKK